MTHVLYAGRVVESGHADLVALGGRYAASWRSQMREAGAAAFRPATQSRGNRCEVGRRRLR